MGDCSAGPVKLNLWLAGVRPEHPGWSVELFDASGKARTPTHIKATGMGVGEKNEVSGKVSFGSEKNTSAERRRMAPKNKALGKEG